MKDRLTFLFIAIMFLFGALLTTVLLVDVVNYESNEILEVMPVVEVEVPLNSPFTLQSLSGDDSVEFLARICSDSEFQLVHVGAEPQDGEPFQAVSTRFGDKCEKEHYQEFQSDNFNFGSYYIFSEDDSDSMIGVSVYTQTGNDIVFLSQWSNSDEMLFVQHNTLFSLLLVVVDAMLYVLFVVFLIGVFLFELD